LAAQASAPQACAQGDVDGACRPSEEEAGALLQVQVGQAAVSKHLMDQAPDPDPTKPDQFGCTCGPNSPIAKDGDCCDGTYNKKGENCFTLFNGALCKDSVCCKDNFNAWCCPSGSACIPQTEMQWNPNSCTEAPTAAPAGTVKSSWVIVGGGPGAPADMGISFKAGVSRSATQTEKETISNAFEVGFEFSGFKMSNTFSMSWETTVEKSVTTDIEVSCEAKCPAGYYLWAFQTEFLGLDTLPSEMRVFVAGCSAVVCSPFGMEQPPACPFGYQADQENGFPCCTSMGWLADAESETDAPPLCSK